MKVNKQHVKIVKLNLWIRDDMITVLLTFMHEQSSLKSTVGTKNLAYRERGTKHSYIYKYLLYFIE